MYSIHDVTTIFCVLWVKSTKLFKERSALTFQFDVSKLQKQFWSVIQTHLDQSANFGPLSTNACDNKPQHKSLKVTRNCNKLKQIHTRSIELNFANIFFKLSNNTRKVCFSMGRFVSLSSINEYMTNCFVTSEDIRKLFKERSALSSQFDASKLHKQLWVVIQTDLDQSAKFGPLPLDVCMRVSHSINR